MAPDEAQSAVSSQSPSVGDLGPHLSLIQTSVDALTQWLLIWQMPPVVGRGLHKSKMHTLRRQSSSVEQGRPAFTVVVVTANITTTTKIHKGLGPEVLEAIFIFVVVVEEEGKECVAFFVVCCLRREKEWFVLCCVVWNGVLLFGPWSFSDSQSAICNENHTERKEGVPKVGQQHNNNKTRSQPQPQDGKEENKNTQRHAALSPLAAILHPPSPSRINEGQEQRDEEQTKQTTEKRKKKV